MWLKGGVGTVDNKELGQLISNTALDMLKQNEEYIRSCHLKELESITDENDKVELGAVINRILVSYLRTSIEISVATTISVLKTLGVEIPNLPSE